MTSAAIILGAGSGSRFGGREPKALMPLLGKPVIVHSLQAFVASRTVTQTVLVVPSGFEDRLREVMDPFPESPVISIVVGGDDRQESVLRGLKALNPGISLVFVHDAARPNIDQRLPGEMRSSLGGFDGIIAARPVVDTLKRASEEEAIIETVARDGLWRAETPQLFVEEKLRWAHRKAQAEGFRGTDDSSLMERYDLRVKLFHLSAPNPKITTPGDISEAKAIMTGGTSIKVGFGQATAAWNNGTQVNLAGIPVVEGASGARAVVLDPLLTATADALAGLGLGHELRMPEDVQASQAESSLQAAASRAAANRIVLSNLDVTVILDQPKISTHREAIGAGLASRLGLAAADVNVKATTTEGLDWEDQGNVLVVQVLISGMIDGAAD